MHAFLAMPGGDDAATAAAIAAAVAAAVAAALSATADALVFDGGDARARAAVAALQPRPERPRLLARIDARGAAIGEAEFDARLDAIVAARPDAVVLPVARTRDLADLGARLAVAEAEHGLPDGGLGIVALVSGAGGVLAADAYTGASPRLRALGWDAEALRDELGVAASWSGGWIPPLAQARALVRLAAAAAGVPAIEAAYPGGDAQGCREAAAAARRDGFTAMLARDPAQASCIRGGA